MLKRFCIVSSFLFPMFRQPSRRLATLIFLFFLWPVTVVTAQEFQEGIAAFNRGHYDIAYRAFRSQAVSNPEAQYYLGRMFEHGEGVGQNTQQAIRWYLKSADSDNKKAQFALGELFARGIGDDKSKNYREAAQWYERAAQNLHEEAAVQLGNFYLSGRGVLKDEVSGVAWLGLAKSWGSAHAEEQLKQLNKTVHLSTFDKAKAKQSELLKKGHEHD